MCLLLHHAIPTEAELFLLSQVKFSVLKKEGKCVSDTIYGHFLFSIHWTLIRFIQFLSISFFNFFWLVIFDQVLAVHKYKISQINITCQNHEYFLLLKNEEGFLWQRNIVNASTAWSSMPETVLYCFNYLLTFDISIHIADGEGALAALHPAHPLPHHVQRAVSLLVPHMVHNQ